MTEEIKPEVKPRPKNKLLAIILLVIAVLYGVLPVDLIPDVLFPLGLGDDVLVALGALSYLYKAFFGKEKEEANHEDRNEN
jgi:uncharacterized membrane protein YkvA (DUF1232 family)